MQVKLTLGDDAVAAMIIVEQAHYLLQLRDSRPDIWCPDHWGCFGGGMEDGETRVEAIQRECYEELGFKIDQFEAVFELNFTVPELGQQQYLRAYFTAQIHSSDVKNICLGEGQKAELFALDTDFSRLRIAPYDYFALYLHQNRSRIEK